MSSAASPPTVPPRGRPATLGLIALGLAVAILVAGSVALAVDLNPRRADPLDIRAAWVVNPLVIVALVGMGLVVPLVLGGRAIVTRRGKNLGATAIALALVPELVALYVIGGTLYNAIFF